MAKQSKFAKKLIASMTQLAEALESGDKGQLTVRQVQLPDDPPRFSAADVRAIRARLNVSQSIFARLLGVSTVLAQSWEQGTRKPSKLACRLLHEINANRKYWLRKLRAA